MPTQSPTPRILLAKIGLDGHDRGVKVLARSFRDAGIEVIYTGLWQTCEATMHAARQEDVDVVGVSLLSAAHMTVMPEMLRIRRELGVESIPVVLGGIVPEADYPALIEMGVAAVFNPGSPMDSIVQKMRELARERRRLPAAEARRAYEAHDSVGLATLISTIQRGEASDSVDSRPSGAKIIGITGSPGVGKSSFIAAFGRQLRQHGKSVAVVAVDPTSPVTGGALLGDRLRMMSGKPDEEFFVRSLASGPVQGGLAPHCAQIVNVFSGFGFEYVLVETVGAGQSDVSIRALAHEVILLLMPESGDSVQFSKAGIMEIATSFVVNKCDLPGAEATEAQLRGVLADDRPIWKVSTLRDEGFEAVTDWALGL